MTFMKLLENNDQTVKQMYALIKKLYQLNKILDDEDSVQSEIRKYLDAIDANLEMV